ncbi:AI-2E family transporter [uncultured Thiodictyon sp.]|uniref:AI-2E family transporter n=1 Tax=uncultured Thiodictyon sp. TaxID=1846217 RepID=UPI0025DE1DA0|nr:AI-2E family transporter [uncultured Thiodictyon sp.]
MLQHYQTRFWLIFGVLFIGLLYLLAPVLAPFMYAAVLAYLGNPLIDRLETKGMERSRAVMVVFGVIVLGLVVLLLILIPISSHQFKVLMDRLPVYIQWLQTSVAPWIHAHFGFDPATFELELLHTRLTDYADKISTVTLGLVQALESSTTVIFTWLAHLVLIPLLTFYLLRDWHVLLANIQQLLPRATVDHISYLTHESDKVVGEFLRGQFIVMVILGFFYSVGLALIGLEFPLIIGMVAGLVSFVPYLGPITGILLASTVSIMEFHSLLSVVPVLILFGLGQFASDFFLTPKLIGDRIGLHPVAVLFAVLAGGHLFGLVGILLALPVAAVIRVLLHGARDAYLNSSLYRG